MSGLSPGVRKMSVASQTEFAGNSIFKKYVPEEEDASRHNLPKMNLQPIPDVHVDNSAGDDVLTLKFEAPGSRCVTFAEEV